MNRSSIVYNKKELFWNISLQSEFIVVEALYSYFKENLNKSTFKILDKIKITTFDSDQYIEIINLVKSLFNK